MPAPKGGNRGSIKPGQKLALGNDKTSRVSTWIAKELEHKASVKASLLGYDQKIQNAQVLAKRLIDFAMDADPDLAMAAIKEVMDRTEGKPKQSTDLTSNGETLGTMIYKPEKYADPERETGLEA